MAVSCAILVSLSVLYFGFSLSRSTGVGTTYGVPTDSNSSIEAMESLVTGYPGGPWTLVSMEGVASTTSLSLSGAQVKASVFYCTNISTIQAPSSLPLYATPKSATAGEAAVWFAVYASPVGDSQTALLVYQGDNRTALMYSGGGCGLGLGGNVSNSRVDSTSAAATVDAVAGQSFLSQNPVTLKVYDLLYAMTFPEWFVDYTTCAAFSGELGFSYYAGLNAATDSFQFDASGSQVCTGF